LDGDPDLAVLEGLTQAERVWSVAAGGWCLCLFPAEKRKGVKVRAPLGAAMRWVG
jgi:hypothetical protein